MQAQNHIIEVQASTIIKEPQNYQIRQLSNKKTKIKQNKYDKALLLNYFSQAQNSISHQILQLAQSNYKNGSEDKIVQQLEQGKIEIEKRNQNNYEDFLKLKLRGSQQTALSKKLRRAEIQKRLEYLDFQTSSIPKSNRNSQIKNQFANQFKPFNILSKQQHQQYMQKIKKLREERTRKHKQMIEKLEQTITDEQEKLKNFENFKMNNQKQKRRMQIQRNLQKKKQEHQKMLDQQKQSQQQYKKIVKMQFLHQKMQQKYQSDFLIPALQQRKKRLKQIRQMSRAFDVKQLLKHQKQYVEKRNQSFSVVKENQKNDWQYKPPQKHQKLVKFLQQQKQQRKKQMLQKKKYVEQKIQRQQNYINYVKQNFVLKIDQEKQKQIQERKNIVTKKREPKIDVKLLGMSYLEQAKKHTKTNVSRAQTSSPAKDIDNQSNLEKNSTKRLTDYLSINRKQKQYYESKRKKRLQSLINSENTVESIKIEKLMQESEKLNQAFNRKNELAKIKKQNIQDDNQAMELLLDGIKAKMGILNICKNQNNQTI